MVDVEYRLARRRDEVHGGGRRDFEEAVRLEEEPEDMQKRVAVAAGYVQCVGGSTDKPRTVRERCKMCAHRGRDLIEGRHADVDTDMRLTSD